MLANVWHRGRLQHVVPRYALGFWLTYRKLISGGYGPGQAQRLLLTGKRPYWLTFDFELASQEQAEQRVEIASDFFGVQLMANATAAEGALSTFRAQIFDAGRNEQERKSRGRIQGRPANQFNVFGTASQPYFLRDLAFFPARTTLAARVQNVLTEDNDVQLVFFGYSYDAAE